ncbi:MAG: hypothetical protein JSV91_01970 [Phycisphaerales bacterium]|nr:MAG: hypothetical protein JSV91_01970 [Phycisphaerales bacterium]
MIGDPFIYFLGLPPTAEPHELLGVEPEESSAVKIETALRRRLARLYEHRDGDKPEAEIVRRRLRLAARYSRIPLPRRPWPVWLREYAARAVSGSGRERPEGPATLVPAVSPSRASPLTSFDQHVMAVLVGCGGWNAVSRGRLVALAAAYGVTVEGLHKVIAGLTAYARSGGPRLGVSQITAGASRMRRLPPAPQAPIHASVALFDRMAPEFSKGDSFSTVKLSALFAIITLLAGILSLRLLITTGLPAPRSEEIAAVDTGDAGSGEGVLRPRTTPTPSGRRMTRPATFADRPTFLGNGLPAAAADAADECPQLVRTLDLVGRKLSLTDDPAEPVFRDWDYAIQAISIGWVLTDASTRQSIDDAVAEALVAAADTPTVADRLLGGLAPPAGRLSESLDLWKGAWKAGTLARISGSNRLPPVVVERARSQLEVALGGRPLTDVPDYGAAGSAWLDRAVPQLVQVLEYGDNVYDDWELWLAAQRELGDGRIPDESLMHAIGAILATETDLSHPGPSINVLGRLLGLADYQASPLVRRRLLGFFDAAETISAHDLWVLTSLLATYDWTPWFDDRLIVPHDADRLFRGRMRDLIDRSWPDTAPQAPPAIPGGRLAVDEALAARWLELQGSVTEPALAGEPDQLMWQLLIACRLNEAAAHLAARRSPRAQAVLEMLDSQAASPSHASRGLPATRSSQTGGAQRPGQPIGTDGVWADEYQALRSNTNAKLNYLQALGSSAGTDLGPIDAAVFVREVYHGTNKEVRSVAQAIAGEQFRTGPNVALELLDEFPDAPRTDAVAELIRRLTGRVLPAPRSESWHAQARLALVEHVLSLTGGGDATTDRLASELIETIIASAVAVAGEEGRSSAPATPQAAAETLLDAWRERASLVVTFSPVPGDLSSLARQDRTRRRLARGPIQQFVASQLAVLDLVTYVAVAEQPAARASALRILREASEERRRSRHVLEQAVLAERTIAAMWRLRLTPPDRLADRGEVRR